MAAFYVISAVAASRLHLAPRMGASVKMIDATYGHLAQDVEEHDRGLLDAYDAVNGAFWARSGHGARGYRRRRGVDRERKPRLSRASQERERRDSNPRPPA